VGNNTPVFFLHDPLKFPDLNHAVKRDPRTNLRSARNNWDFWTSLPEALHQVTIVMSDRGIPATYRHMHGFGSHTFSLINANKERFWVKFHLKTQQGIKNLTDEQAEAAIGKCRESRQRDLYESIEKGDFPRWTLFIQVMPEKEAATCAYHPFDLTKVWFHRDYPLIEVGVMELNKNPENYFAEPPLGLEGAADHWDHRQDTDYYSQPGKLFRLMGPEQQQVLFANTARAMGDAPKPIKVRHIGNCYKADPAYGKGVADALGISLSEVPEAK